MKIWRIAVLVVGAFPSMLLAANPNIVIIVKSITFQEVNSAVSRIYTLTCPAGTRLLDEGLSFSYPAGTAEAGKDGINDIAGIIPILASEAFEVRFNLQLKGRWSVAEVRVVCIKVTSPASGPVVVTTSVTPSPGSNIVSGAAFCPAGQTVLGGYAAFGSGSGQVYEQTANVNINDPFNLIPLNAPPVLFDVFGICLTAGCRLDITALCATLPDDHLIIGKRAQADGAQSPAASNAITNKATVAPGAAGTVTATCPAGMLSTSAGYVASDATKIRLLDLFPVTPGTPYSQRPDGTYEAPNGWSATILNTGTSPNQIGVTAVCVVADQPGTTVFEFFNTALKHYFRTAEGAEATAIDGGAAGPGWVRTGLNFTAYVAGTGPGNDVCRFYNPVANTHFFTADPAECAQVKLPDSGWRYEGLAFRIQLPSAGACPTGTNPVYRNYNNRFAFNDSNHRFTTSQSVYNDMIAQGWTGEGVVMCALAS